ncbi:hypothetical protein Q9966_004184 [Columba livia]|nr:hypothetical protein Q9966_004184 [Columba livia]
MTIICKCGISGRKWCEAEQPSDTYLPPVAVVRSKIRQGFENKVSKPSGVFLDCLAWDIVGTNSMRIKEENRLFFPNIRLESSHLYLEFKVDIINLFPLWMTQSFPQTSFLEKNKTTSKIRTRNQIVSFKEHLDHRIGLNYHDKQNAAMAAAIAFALAVLAVEHILKPEPQIDVATAERMRQREEYLRQEMDQLLREMEWCRSAEGTALLSAMQHCLLLGIALVLVLLAVASRLIRRRKLAFENQSEQDSSSRKEEDNEEVKELNGTHNGVRSLAVSTPLLMQVPPDKCKALQQLVGDLLGVCRMLSKKTFMPQMYPATGMDGVYESWGVHENNIFYCLLVFLRPPPGHSFSLELDTMGQPPPRHSSIRVALDCMCSSEQLLADSLCLLHHLDDNLARDQSSYLLRTLCTCSCLDVEKLACWVQELVKTAWLFLPQSHHCQLTVLPSHQSCRFQLTSTSQMSICTEMMFAVQQGSSIA